MPTRSEEKVRAVITNDATRRQLVRAARRVLSPEDSEDAAHDAVVQALVHADQYREDAQVGTWLHRIAFNAALVKRRSGQRSERRLRRAHEATNVAPGTAAPAALPPRELEERQLRDQLRAAVERLPADYRAAVQRCVYDEVAAERVAVELGITPSALRTRITRARDRLRTLMVSARAA